MERWCDGEGKHRFRVDDAMIGLLRRVPAIRLDGVVTVNGFPLLDYVLKGDIETSG